MNPLAVILLVAVAAVVTAGSAGASGLPGVHQDAAFLTRSVSPFAVSDGLLTAGLAGATYSPRTTTEYGLPSYSVLAWRLWAEYGLLPGLSLRYEQSLRSWSGWTLGEPESGAGLADGQADAVLAVPGLPDWLGASFRASTNLPVGAPEIGEDAVSPQAMATLGLRFWQRSRLPEMRVMASYGRRWNRNEASGYGVGLGPGPQPWWPRYPDAASAGGDGDNDFTLWSVALEFRRGATAFWLEYFAAELDRADNVAPSEDDRTLSAAVRWGLAEGWAVHLTHQVHFYTDYFWNDYVPVLPDLVLSLGISRQFSIGGRDRDGDGVPDRRDACPRAAEDRDGFQDDDGCPDDDNDEDGILDAQDDCPGAPEDFDGFADGDGCPDSDNDGDGILDARDACPDEPEDFDGDRDGDGCPEEFVDSDGDLIPDVDDLCPGGSEDRDGFEDEDGCPDPDNDLDGIADADDACPDEPEDYDGDRDDDGCPDREAEGAQD